MISPLRLRLRRLVCPKSEDYLKEECVFRDNGSLKKCLQYSYSPQVTARRGSISDSVLSGGHRPRGAQGTGITSD
uniref:Uncharacterized protein n=1 Tax=Anguilla anguilla TaxID=7936 RepID=A0A0E9VVP7_ANGAN